MLNPKKVAKLPVIVNFAPTADGGLCVDLHTGERLYVGADLPAMLAPLPDGSAILSENPTDPDAWTYRVPADSCLPLSMALGLNATQ